MYGRPSCSAIIRTSLECEDTHPGYPLFHYLDIYMEQGGNEAYNMLLGRPWLIDAKVYHGWGKKVVTIQGNGILKTISVNRQLGPRPQLSEVLVCYNIVEGLSDKKEYQLPSIEADLFVIGTISLFRELIGASS
jgi:hypothetical protein